MHPGELLPNEERLRALEALGPMSKSRTFDEQISREQPDDVATTFLQSTRLRSE